ncbi:MAG: hypothetical protein J0H91_03840 [Rhodospirillales bacterium]|nr:hypothetical protein [Rhodospirillales bacterium]
MRQSGPILCSLAAVLAISAVAACAQQAPPPPAAPQHDAATAGPELAGA